MRYGESRSGVSKAQTFSLFYISRLFCHHTDVFYMYSVFDKADNLFPYENRMGKLVSVHEGIDANFIMRVAANRKSVLLRVS